MASSMFRWRLITLLYRDNNIKIHKIIKTINKMQKFVTVKLISGIVVTGELIKTDINVIEVKVNTPYFIKHYIDNSCNKIDETMSNGANKVIYMNNNFILKKKKDYTIATIKKNLIASM